MIEVDHVAKHFGLIQAVQDVSFRVNKGEILGFLGPNGAGKTTTMRVLTGFYPPTSGSARVDGLDVFEKPMEIRKMIGYLPENVPLYGEMTVSGYLRFVAEVKRTPRSKRTESIGAAMEACQLNGVSNRYISKLSKGYRQRVGLAQALIGDPDVLILDEPTIGLDPKQINEIRKVIKGFAGRKTVILSTHILPEVSMTCDRVVIVNQGRVVAEDTPANLSTQLSGSDRIRLKASGPAAEISTSISSIAGVHNVSSGDEEGLFHVEAEQEARPEIAKVICNAGWDLFEMSPMTATLEEVFLNLVTTEQEAADDE